MASGVIYYDADGKCRRLGVDAAIIDAHELGRILVVAGSAHCTTISRAIQVHLQAGNDKHAHDKGDQREHTDVNRVRHLNALDPEHACINRSGVRREEGLQKIGDHHRDAESHQDGSQASGLE